MSIIEKQINLKVTAERAQQARNEFKNNVAELIKKMQQENIKKTKGTSPKELEAGQKEYSLIVKAAAKDLPRDVVENKDKRRKHFVKIVAKNRAERIREQDVLNA